MSVSFKVILQEVTALLNDSLPSHLTYHRTSHTLYVLDKSIYIAEKEQVSSSDLKLIKLAALYHDIGFTKTHTEHEKASCEIAKRQLKAYGYAEKDIEIICGIIMATKIPQNPQNHLEEIVADADLEYLATNNFTTFGERLFEELKFYYKDMTRNQWNKLQIDFISKHTYHTNYCKRYKSFRKKKNLEALKRSI